MLIKLFLKIEKIIKNIFLCFYAKYTHKKYLFFKRFLSNSDIQKVLCRTCCLGNECLNYLKVNNQIHFQKLRIDAFLKDDIYPNNSEILKYLRNYGLFDFINQFQINPLSIKKYKFIIFDSFSELVDSKFKLPNNKVFYAVKSDIKIDYLISKGGKYLKQIDLKEIKNLYSRVFQKLWETYNCKIYFILCPTKFDKRNYYKERSLKIKKAIKSLAKENDFLICIDPDDGKIFKNDSDSFPYHFSHETIKYISDLLSSNVSL